MSDNRINIEFSSPIDYLFEQKRKLLDARSKIDAEILKLDAAISAIKGVNAIPNKTVDSDDDRSEFKFLDSMDWKNEIISFLEKKNEFMKSTDIADQMFPSFTGQVKDKALTKVRNVVAYQASRPDTPIKAYVTTKPQVYYYGLPAWFDEDGSVKSEYLNKMTKAPKSEASTT